MTSTEIWLRLSGVKNLSGMRMLEAATTLISLNETSADALRAAGLNPEQASQFWQCDPRVLENTCDWLASPQHHLLTADAADYPPQLKNIASYPPLLFIAGNREILSSPQLAVVGSRDCSHYGREWGAYFTQALALSGLTITSGLALGIDGVAHRAALDVEGKTIAVLGSGLAALYPKRHTALASEIIAAGGALVSEFPLSTRPLPQHFPQRNRIISGLSAGVLVIEATLRSGSLVTARYALEQNREVYALPGALGNSGSEGVHWLIQQGALLVAHPNNILEEMNSNLNWLPFLATQPIYSSDNADVPLPFADVLANVGDEVTPVDVVAERAGQPVPAIVAKLLELELAGWIAAVPGGYVRLRRACHVRRINVLI
ncbi:DNA-protecting protein DprA [Erwinia iniecta]|uniref:DNA processing protein DprA n=3 Tax=Winslowiella iniecta TaxID=1560201 RepID=A0A0L7SWB6_9GAMM|nr:DNA processing protein DprA [Winslowiella iniecta]